MSTFIDPSKELRTLVEKQLLESRVKLEALKALSDERVEPLISELEKQIKLANLTLTKGEFVPDTLN